MKLIKFSILAAFAFIVFSTSVNQTAAQQTSPSAIGKAGKTKILFDTNEEARSGRQIKLVDNSPLLLGEAVKVEPSEVLDPVIQPEAVLVDEIVGPVTSDEIKARIDNFMTRLQGDPSATGYVINYGTPRETIKRENVIRRAFAFRRFSTERITFADGSFRAQVTTKLYLVPAGAQTPTP